MGAHAAKKLDRAVDEFLARQKHLSARRQKNLYTYLSAFAAKFGKRCLNDVNTSDLKDWILEKVTWKAPKTRNEVRSAVGLIYCDAEQRGYVPRGKNPAAAIKTERMKNKEVGIFLPEAVRSILASLEPELALPMVCWLFGGFRKENLIRVKIEAL